MIAQDGAEGGVLGRNGFVVRVPLGTAQAAGAATSFGDRGPSTPRPGQPFRQAQNARLSEWLRGRSAQDDTFLSI